MITPLVSHPRSSRLFCQLTLLFLATSSSVFAQGIPPLDAYYKFDNSYDATPAAFTTNLTAEGSGQSFQPGGIIGTGPNCLTLSGSGSACFVLLSDDAPVEEIIGSVREAWGPLCFVHPTVIA